MGSTTAARPAPLVATGRRLADQRAPLEVIGSLSVEPGLSVLHGDWCGGGTIIAREPVATASDRSSIAVALGSWSPAPAGPYVGGGWFGWLSYPDAARGAASDRGPTDHLGLYPNVVRFRGDDGGWYDEALSGLIGETDLAARRRDYAAGIGRSRRPGRYRVGLLRPRQSRASYLDAVLACIERIRAGDVYQANLCLQLEASFHGDVVALFADLVGALRPAYGALMSDETRTVVSVSPELFVRRSGTHLLSAPIKGTRPKSPGQADPDPAVAELLASSKERAENIMIVDLVRNDLGRVARIGSVSVPSLLAVEEHCGVWHLVSRVSGELARGRSDADLLAATFPAASITGAPKHAAREIIAGLEQSTRGVYTGAVGYLSPFAGVELSVAIRTATIEDGRLTLGVGAGITLDSDPAQEWAECLHKAAPLERVWS